MGITAVNPPADSEITPGYLPFKNMLVFRLIQWFYDSSLTKSLGTLNDLVYNVLLALSFDVKDLTGFDAAREVRWLDDDKDAPAPANLIKDGWTETTVPISVPCDNVSYPSEADAPVFHMKGVMYHKPLEVIKATFEDPSAEQVHISKFPLSGILATKTQLSSQTTSGNTNLALAVFGCLWESLIVFANDWVHFGV